MEEKDMELASKILIVGGLFGLAIGGVTGFFFIVERRRAEHASRYLAAPFPYP